MTADKTDMLIFRLTAWTDDPSRVPTTKTLEIPEAEIKVIHNNPNMERTFANVEPYLMKKRTLEYMTIIHIRSIADFSPRDSSSDDQPSTDGDSGHDGNPERYPCGQGHGGPRIQGFRCHRGVPDGAPQPPPPPPSENKTKQRSNGPRQSNRSKRTLCWVPKKLQNNKPADEVKKADGSSNM